AQGLPVDTDGPDQKGFRAAAAPRVPKGRRPWAERQQAKPLEPVQRACGEPAKPPVNAFRQRGTRQRVACVQIVVGLSREPVELSAQPIEWFLQLALRRRSPAPIIGGRGSGRGK